jgi:DNA-binding beta-propeller fold protein YncE
MRKPVLILASGLVLALGLMSCENPAKSNAGWNLTNVISLDSIGAVGIAAAENGNLWLADADNNRLIKVNAAGVVREIHLGFERPMHITSRGNALLVAEYGADRLSVFQAPKRDTLGLDAGFDAPSGIDREAGLTAVADFYNHRIVLLNGKTVRPVGEKGTGPGQLTYPTDVQFANGKMFVADAYNHRVQVFTPQGKHLLTFGEEEKMNAATGIFVSAENVFVTDFENSRLLIYNLEGELQGILSETLNKPTDVVQIEDRLYVLNYNGRSVSVFRNLEK